MSFGQRLRNRPAPGRPASEPDPSASISKLPAASPPAPVGEAAPRPQPAAPKLQVVAPPKAKAPARVAKPNPLEELKFRVHARLFEILDLSQAEEMNEETHGDEVMAATQRILQEEGTSIRKDEKVQLLREIKDEVFGLGPLEPLLRDPGVCDILVNGPHQVFIERAGKLEPTAARFRDDAHLLRIIERIVSQVGRRIDESNPMVDARLPDGSRVNAIIPPLALDGPSMSIRRFAADQLDHNDMIRFGSMTSELVQTLQAAVHLALNIVVSGGTGSGKTTLLNILSSFIPEDERIVTIEDSAELQLRQEHVVRLETRPANLEGRGQITQRELLVNTLRMRPDRIIVGECRSGEALDMLQAMNTGHDGSLTTVHANTPRDALSRLEVMVAMSGVELPRMAARAQIASAVDLVIQQQRLTDGSRKVTSVQEIVGVEGDVVTMQEIFTLERHGIDEDGKIIASLVPTGVRPRFVDRLEEEGIQLPDDLFRPPSPRPESLA